METTMHDTDAPPPAAPWWMGGLAGMAAAAVALGFGELIGGISETIPGLVLAVGELVVDYTPGWAAESSIENLGTAGKGNLLLGITIVSFLIANLLGQRALRLGDRHGVIGLAVFGIFGGWAVARNPQSPFFASWFWALVAAGLGIVTLRFLLRQARRTMIEHVPAVGLDAPIASPLDPPQSRRAFLGFSAGAGAVALTGVGAGRALEGTGAGDLARAEVVLPEAVAEAAPSTTTSLAERATGAVSAEPFDIPGLSSWVTPSTNDQFYRIDTALSFPQVDPADWSLKFTGMVDNPYELTYDEILGMDLVERTITLSCVSNPIGGELVGNAVWTGVPLADLLDRAGVQDGATQIVGRSVDDFTAGFPTETVYDGRNAMLVVGQNGEPLQVRHGFPARLVIAGLYGYVSATKWIEEINLTTWEAFNGYWINLGWAKDGPMKTTSRIDVPAHRAQVEAGATPVAGVAWSPVRGIEAVEISIDEGAWQVCDLAVPGTDETWVQWKTEWDAEPGIHRIDVRAIDKTGAVQPVGPKDVAPDGAEGYHAILVEVV
ncbi:MAG: molybdopterin-dependent oxidoreductase [Actinomycetota bacterium]